MKACKAFIFVTQSNAYQWDQTEVKKIIRTFDSVLNKILLIKNRSIFMDMNDETTTANSSKGVLSGEPGHSGKNFRELFLWEANHRLGNLSNTIFISYVT